VLSGKKKSISVHGGSQVIGSIAAVLGVEKRKLGQGEEQILVPLRRQTCVQLGQRFSGILLKALV
jgi:hypothetical protein